MAEHQGLAWLEVVRIAEDDGEVVGVDLEDAVGEADAGKGLIAGVENLEADRDQISWFEARATFAAGATNAFIVALIAGRDDLDAVSDFILNNGQRDGGKVDLIAECAEPSAEHLEVALPRQKLLFESGEVFEVGSTFHGGAEAIDPELGRGNAALEVDDAFGHIIGGDALVAQLANPTESIEGFGEIIWTNLEDERGFRPRSAD